MRTAGGKTVSISLDRTSETPIYQQIYLSIQKSIATGALGAGERLPSARQLATDIGVSRPTVERAYQQLTVEGYVQGVARSGYVVLPLDTQFLREVQTSQARCCGTRETLAPNDLPNQRREFFEEYDTPSWVRYDFAFARLAPGTFPVREWLHAETEALYYGGDDLLTNYPLEQRPNRLQTELSHYLERTREVTCAPCQVLILPSTEIALQTIIQLFDRDRDALGAEEPGFATFWEVGRRLGFQVEPLAVDQGFDRYLSDLDARRPRVVFVTPSHQFPTGHVMPMGTRIELLKWARDNDAFLIEDDSCSEYRFDADPIPSLQSLDGGERVIYLGNFSKTLSPGLRVAYAVIPRRLIERFFSTFPTTCSGVSLITQETLGRLISSGEYDRHVRRMVAMLKRRHDLLLSNLREEFADGMSLSGTHAGMHLLATVHTRDANESGQCGFLASAAREGAKVYWSQPYWFSRPAPGNQVILGFSSISTEAIVPGVRALRRAWG
jgi:GntR family transcriptional regulator/MocR family aminotransferase